MSDLASWTAVECFVLGLCLGRYTLYPGVGGSWACIKVGSMGRLFAFCVHLPN